MNNLGAALTLDGVLDRPQENRRQAAHRTVSTLFDEVRDPLARYLIHTGISRDNVEEAVQAAFLKLYEHLLAGGPTTNLRGWVFRVARNAALNEIRRGRRFVSADSGQNEVRSGSADITGDERVSARPGVETSLEKANEDGAGQSRQPDQILLERERNQRLRAALSRLTKIQRECLHLRAAGLKYREIGELIGMPTSTVADCLTQALEQLGEECDG